MDETRTVRNKGGGRKIQLQPIFDKVRLWFERFRSAGHYVDRSDIYYQYQYEAKQFLDACTKRELEGERLSVKERVLKIEIEKREKQQYKV